MNNSLIGIYLYFLSINSNLITNLFELFQRKSNLKYIVLDCQEFSFQEADSFSNKYHLSLNNKNSKFYLYYCKKSSYYENTPKLINLIWFFSKDIPENLFSNTKKISSLLKFSELD